MGLFCPRHDAAGADRGAGLSGKGAAELAVLGTTTSGAVQVLVKDSATGLLVQKVVFDNPTPRRPWRRSPMPTEPATRP